ncbi:MAG: cytochrome c3 family protein [Opitutaceae bacterium]
MNPSPDTPKVFALLTVAFLALAYSFARVPARPGRVSRPLLVPADALAIVPGTVRISAGQLMRSGGDVSGLDCYACHHKESPPEVKFDANHRIVLPKEHADLIISMRNCAECHPPSDPVKLNYDDAGNVVVPQAHLGLLSMAHGHTLRNNNCYNCHDRDQLDQLHTPDGAALKFEQATLLCAACHGPTYRDWMAGAHGRTAGFWDRKAGPIKREECTSCHDPHAPAFTGIIPMPGPHPLHPLPPSRPGAPGEHGL